MNNDGTCGIRKIKTCFSNKRCFSFTLILHEPNIQVRVNSLVPLDSTMEDLGCYKVVSNNYR